MYELMKKLYPICRSITGDGVRDTLNIIKEIIPIKIHEVPSGTKAFDWVVPKEWNIKDAYIKNSKGEKIVDFRVSNLHVLNYSIPINTTVTLDELRKHTYTLLDHPDWIPYVTSYYAENWGFCMSHKQYEKLEDDIYEVVIDSTLEDGSLTYGELFIKGESNEEVLFSTYLCHPSLCNDNLSGVVLTTFLAKLVMGMKPFYSYRFLFIPETIGSIIWLSRNEDKISKIKHGLVVTCVGHSKGMTYKRSRRGNAEIDKVVEKVLLDSGHSFEIIGFLLPESDERQYCSLGFDLPVGSLMRIPYGHFPEYHTSADDLDLVKPIHLEESLDRYMDVIFILENNGIYLSTNPKCEPQLGRRGLYRTISKPSSEISAQAVFWFLNLADGTNSLLDISLQSGIDFKQIKETSGLLIDKGLLIKSRGETLG